MIWRRPIELVFLLAALGACTSRGNDVSEGLKSVDWHERQRAVWALGDSQDHAGAVRALEAVLRHDPDHDVRFSAAVSLGRLGGPDATALLLEKAASTDESDVRGAAVISIATSRDPSAIPGLINLFRLNRGDDDVSAQNHARHALLKIGAPVVPQLLEALNDPSAKVREAAVEVLGEMGNPEVADRIAALQADPDFGVRWRVENVLAKLKATKQ
jgi:HEAT repeat protein